MVKAVWLSGTPGAYVLKSCISVPTPPKGMQSESPFDQEELAQVIRKIISDAKIGPKKVHIALPDAQVFTKVIDMPPLSEKELTSAITWEAEQYVPASLAEMTLSWTVLRQNAAQDAEKTMQVLLVAAPTALISRYQNIIKMAGLTAVSIETEIISTIRSVVLSAKAPTTLIVSVGSTNSTIAIVQDGILVFTYTVPLGGMGINRAIAVDFGFSLAQAEEYKKVYGISDKNLGAKIGHAIEPILISLLGEVKKALAFYNERYKTTSPIRQIVLSGGTANLPGMDLYFAHNLGIETLVANPWNSLGMQNIPQALQDTAAQFPVAVGLALKDNE
ncbi:type IV pilus assembly protein PilM [soil metagenome]